MILVNGESVDGAGMTIAALLSVLSMVVLIAVQVVQDVQTLETQSLRERIAQHRRQRPASWDTLEAPTAVAATLTTLDLGAVVLIDCLSMLVSNLLLAYEPNAAVVVDAEITSLIAAAQARDLTLIVVTNEVGMGIVPESALGRHFRDVAGLAHQRIAKEADEVYLAVLGTILRIKPAPAFINT